jgi:hypothetical protein
VTVPVTVPATVGVDAPDLGFVRMDDQGAVEFFLHRTLCGLVQRLVASMRAVRGTSSFE